MQRGIVNYAVAVGLAVAGWSLSAHQAEAGRWAVGYVAGPAPVVPVPVVAAPVVAVPVVPAPVVVPGPRVIQPVGGIVGGAPGYVPAPGYVAAPGPVVVNQWGSRGLLHNRYNVRVSNPYGPDYGYRVRRNLTGTHVRQFVAP